MSTQQRRAVVVGAGVGGLAAAGALARDGWQVDLLERRPQIRAVGAGLSLWPNALRAIAAIDPAAVDQLRGRNELQDMVGLRRPDGRWLSRVEPSPAGAEDADSAGAADAFTVPLMVTRPKLYDVLRDLVPAESLHLGRTATGVDAGPAGAVVRTDGEEYPADLVVAADGIHSRLRTSVDPRTRTRGAGYVTWRALIPPESAPALVSGSETWGRGQRFGCIPLADGGVYWYATLAHADPRYRADGAEDLPGLFADWHDPVPRLLGATPPDRIIRTDIELLWPLPRTFVRDRLVLLGDAAHAMTPDLGQGACQALEDAVELATVVRSAGPGEVPAALPEYDRLRRARTTGLARQARVLGLIGQVRNPLGARLRDRLISLVPANKASRSLTSPTTWEPTGVRS
ncbi:2-polyprenyl-6-methoxyphenol hydroxylase [Actinopolymorpha cephalotaxi]|uniref:2-polyprenyl-6-methoxyphenol hydroxylase n=1 Tax=Actinopolymorpha cephalotaxi TaxID=504797 RepID=A0A1I2M7J6_9ACTN|nr:FAD-dependent monooxygenase [Actinopolymorpha cephalotaxi]NYH81624.1 2-polyprenyl-6-methoxyphenol hydroxylase-like FAD-dependent oxidoreductase [Actinopolymorpha cephalotaxi]SFF87442.1 2-polyprenyl-6-methoxyphenol hydroxylase [Actinopolymorpha cephalotaxi]